MNSPTNTEDTRRGLLLVTMEPPASLEEEFNDWYDTEHFVQRRAVPGCLTATRWVCVEGWPRWLALYDLDSVDVLKSPAYLAVSGVHSTPWSKRVLSRTIGRQRAALQVLFDDQPLFSNDSGTSQLLVFSWKQRIPEEMMRIAEGIREKFGMAQVRAFISDGNESVDLWMMIGTGALADVPEHVNAIRNMCGETQPNMFNRYVPYIRCDY